MSRSDGSGAGRDGTLLALQSNRVLEALDGEVMTGPAIFRRISERSEEDSAASGDGVQPNDQSLLYPVLHSLEAGWKLQAAWLSGPDGTKHRAYMKRRLLPGRPGRIPRS